MKSTKSILFSLAAVTLLAAFVFPQLSDEQKEAVLLQTLVQGMERYHYSPQDLDDSFSEKAYDLYMNSIDGGKRFFTADEVAKLEEYRHQLDDQIKASEFGFFNMSQDMLSQALERAQGYYRDILSDPFDFSEGVK